jgi:hypothetical protein
MTRTVTLCDRNGNPIGTAEIDMADGEPKLLAADNGTMFVRGWRHIYFAAIPVAIVVKAPGP